MTETLATPARQRDPRHTFGVALDQFASSPLRKYILVQVPESILFTLLIAGLHYFDKISPTTAFVCIALWLVKDLALYPLLRPAYEPGPAHGTDALVGATGVVTRAIEPEGHVRVGAELWRARGLGEPSEPIDVGCRIVVEAVDGFTLLVVPRQSDPKA